MADSELVIKIKGDASDLKKSLDGVKSETENFAGGLKAIAGAISFGAIVSGVDHLTDKFIESELAGERLTLSLQNQGIYSDELQTKYEQLAASIQAKTGVDDDQIVAGQALLQSYVGQREISEELTKATVDLAAAKGIDLKTAFDLVGKTIGTNTNALARNGIEIDSNLSKQEKIQQIVTQVNAKWGDQAAVLAKVDGGTRITAAGFSDLQERLGGKFMPIVENINKVFQTLINLFMNNDWMITAARDITLVAAALTGVATATYAVTTAWNILKATNPLLLVISSVIAALVLLVAHWDSVVNFMQAAWQAFADNVLTVADNLFNALHAAMTFDFDKAAEYWENAKTSFTTGFEDFKATRDQLQAEDDEEQNAKDAAKDQARKDRNNTAYAEQTKLEQDIAESVKKMREQDYQDQVKNNARFIVEQQKFGTIYAAINKAMHSEIYQGTKTAFGELAQLQQSSNETLKGIGKAAAVANIIIKTAESAMNIYAGFSTIPIIGPALGVAGAAAAIAFGAEQVGRVTAAADGGLATGGVPGVDSIPFLLQQGELVTPTKNYEEVVSSVAATRLAEERGLVGEGPAASGGNTYIFNGDVLADDVFIDRLVEKISDRVEFGNARLLASEV